MKKYFLALSLLVIYTSSCAQQFGNVQEPISSIEVAENGGYPPTQNGDIRSLFWLFSLMALQN